MFGRNSSTSKVSFRRAAMSSSYRALYTPRNLASPPCSLQPGFDFLSGNLNNQPSAVPDNAYIRNVVSDVETVDSGTINNSFGC